MKESLTGPAPRLTKIQFDAIRGDADPNWQPIYGAQSPSSPCTGQTLHVALTFFGYQNNYTVVFYDNSTSIDSQVTWYMNMSEPQVGADKIVWGFREYYSIPFSAITNHSSLYVTASGLNGGQASSSLWNVQIIPKTSGSTIKYLPVQLGNKIE